MWSEKQGCAQLDFKLYPVSEQQTVVLAAGQPIVSSALQFLHARSCCQPTSLWAGITVKGAEL